MTRSLILTSHEVRGILAGRQSQFRRVVKYQPELDWTICGTSEFGFWHEALNDTLAGPIFQCPFGKPGDLLVCKETFCERSGDLLYRADGKFEKPSDCTAFESEDRWKSAATMARWASRITLELTDVRVERLNSISEEDAQAEGVQPMAYGDETYTEDDYGPMTYQYGFEFEWDFRNSKRGHGWETNPWIWACTFRTAGGRV